MTADWMDRAACAGMDVEWFFTDSLAEVAKDVYQRCPVRPECLDYVTHTQGASTRDYGVWGGTTPEERRGRGRRPFLSRADVGDSRIVARREGVDAAAARYGVTRRTLHRIWSAAGMPPIPTIPPAKRWSA